MTMAQAQNDNAEMALLQNWDKQKTMPLQYNRQTSAKKRKVEKRERKSDRKSESKPKKMRGVRSSDANKNSTQGSNKKTIRYDRKHQYNQSLGALVSNATMNSLHTNNTVSKNPIYSTIGSQNTLNNSNQGIQPKQIKSQISKRMIK